MSEEVIRLLREAAENAEPKKKPIIEMFQHKVEKGEVEENRIDRFLNELEFQGLIDR